MLQFSLKILFKESDLRIIYETEHQVVIAKTSGAGIISKTVSFGMRLDQLWQIQLSGRTLMVFMRQKKT